MSEMLASLQLKFSPTVRRDILVEKNLFTMRLPEHTVTTQLVRADKPLRIVFPFIAQIHQSLHSLPIAAAMAKLYPEVEVRRRRLTTAAQSDPASGDLLSGSTP